MEKWITGNYSFHWVHLENKSFTGRRWNKGVRENLDQTCSLVTTKSYMGSHWVVEINGKQRSMLCFYIAVDLFRKFHWLKAVCQILKFILFDCFIRIDLSPLNVFPLPASFERHFWKEDVLHPGCSVPAWQDSAEFMISSNRLLHRMAANSTQVLAVNWHPLSLFY